MELLPALPQEVFVRGTLRGVLARGGIVIEELDWNTTLLRISATLRSPRAQEIVLRLGIDMRTMQAEDVADRQLVSREKNGWRVRLPADRSLRLRCVL